MIANSESRVAATGKLAYEWPFALDTIGIGFSAEHERKFLTFIAEHFQQLSPTAEIKVLKGIGYVTQDPENIEVLLSTHPESQTTLPHIVFVFYMRSADQRGGVGCL